MDWIRANRSLVDILLYRHYQHYGGLMLPPTAPAIQAMRAHEADVAAASTAGRSSSELPHIMFPAFGPPPPPDEGEVGGGVRSPKGEGKSSSSPPGQSNPWGSIGDRRGFGGGQDGGASGGGVYF
jgi:hypothetical protein